MTRYSQQPIGQTNGSRFGALKSAMSAVQSSGRTGAIKPMPSALRSKPKPLNLGDGPTRLGAPISSGSIGPKPTPLNLNDGPRRLSTPMLPVGNTGPFKPGTPGTKGPNAHASDRAREVHAALAAGTSPRKVKANAAKSQRQERMMKKLKANKGKVDRKQKDRFMRAAEFRMAKRG
jgi:hypothetical protein